MTNAISHSDDIKEIVSSLVKVQAVMKPAIYNRINPHFKSRYADFASCMDACRGPLSSNDLAIVQSCEVTEGKMSLITLLMHTSGQWMKSEFPIISTKMDSQGIGSAMTYAKRYSLCALLGIVADEEADDDGEAAVGRHKKEMPKKAPAEEEDELNKLLERFDKDDRFLVLEYIEVIMKHFDWSKEQCIKKFLEEKSLIDKFNAWKNKRKVA